MNKKSDFYSNTNDEDDDFNLFYQIAQSPSRSSSENISPDFYDRPRSKSVMYENINNLLPPDQYYLQYIHPNIQQGGNSKDYKAHNQYNRRSPSPSRKSLGNLPVVKTMLKIEESNSLTMICSNNSVSPRRPSLSPMRMDSSLNQLDGIIDEYKSDTASNEVGDTNEDLCHIRSFKLTDKGMVNQGDCLVSRSTGNIHYSSNTTAKSQSNDFSKGKSQLNKPGSSFNSSDMGPPLKIQILGANGVGKTTLASQFMTSEQICCRMFSVNEETEKLFSLRIDGHEWNILLHDTVNSPAGMEVQVEILDKMDAYLVLFAIDDLASFDYSKQILNDLIEMVGLNSLIYLVGNKADLERSREVKTKVSKSLAKAHRCKSLEISTGLNHKVDELLCQLIMDINSRHQNQQSSCKSSAQSFGFYRRRESQLVATGRAIGRLIKKTFGAKSCEAIP